MAGEREPMMHARRASAFGATRESAATSWESEHWPGRSVRSRGRAGGPWTSAKSALLAAFSLAAIALLCTQVDVFANGRRSGRVKRREAAAREIAAATKAAATKARAPSQSTYVEDAAVERDLLIGDKSVAYVSRGWNAERRLIGEEKVEAIWEGPASTNKNGELEATKPKGALLALHGCHHSAKDFFANNTKCTECRGLAQEMVITRTALNKGYVVIAISSFGTCWSKDIDAPRVKAVLDVFFNDTALSHLPLYAFGASSGGSFVGMLPQLELKQKLSGLIIQIAPGPTVESKAELASYPPTVFSHMPRDERTAKFVASSLQEFRKAGVRVVESRLEPRAIEDGFFYQDSFGKISEDESAALRATLRSFNLLDRSNKLTEDPRNFDDDHVEMLKRHAPEWDSLLTDKSDIRELLNVAYAMHELSAEHFAHDLAWLIRSSARS